MRVALAPIVLMALCVLASGAPQWKRITQLEGEKRRFPAIVTGNDNYGLTSKQFASQNWKTVSVNGNKLVATAEDCSRLETTFEELNEEQRNSIASAIELFAGGTVSESDQNFVAEFHPGNTVLTANEYERNSRLSELGREQNKHWLLELTDYNYSIRGVNLEEKMKVSRIFFVNDVVAIVYSDGRVNMQPENCFQLGEKQLLDDIKYLLSKRAVRVNRGNW